jgi:O-methyltransferase
VGLLNRIRRREAKTEVAADLDPTVDPADRAIVERSLPHTMTGALRLQSVIDAVRYCERRQIPGAFAECGVWRGGSVLAMILALQRLEVADRDLHLFDTFEGMTAPTELDVSRLEPPALETWRQAHAGGRRAWHELFDPETFNQDRVRALLSETGYPSARIHLVPGRVEETIPDQAPETLALLRLDTDWYESTRHELEHLYPRLATGGVLIVDDYGHWDGCRRAVDEYFADRPPPLLARVDYTCRMAIKH